MKWLTFLFSLLIVLIIVLADRGQLGFLGVINQLPFADKVGHFVLYGILTLLLDLTLFQSKRFVLPPSLLALRVAVVLGLLIGLEEYSQQFFAKRTFDLVDLTFSYLGVLFFSWLALKIQREKTSRAV
jgi:polysaccharide biosynthesis protein VpsQ